MKVVIERLRKKGQGRNGPVRIVETPAFIVEDEAQAVLDAANADNQVDNLTFEFSDLPRYENLADYLAKVVDRRRAEHRDKALQKLAKLTAEERESLGINLPDDLPPVKTRARRRSPEEMEAARKQEAQNQSPDNDNDNEGEDEQELMVDTEGVELAA